MVSSTFDIIRRFKNYIIFFCLLGSSSAIGQQNAKWHGVMNQFIIDNSKGLKIAISYSSLKNTLDQYHGNSNITAPSSELIKAPFLFATLLALENGSLNEESTFEIKATEIARNGDGLLGPEDIGKSFTAPALVNALVHFSDHSAANLLLRKVNMHRYFEKFAIKNTYFKIPLVDSLKNSTLGIKNQTSTADIINFQKYAFKKLSRKKAGKRLLEVLKQENKVANNKFLNSLEKTYFIEEDSDFVQGFSLVNDGEKPYLLSIMVMDFSDKALAKASLENATKVFIDSYR